LTWPDEEAVAAADVLLVALALVLALALVELALVELALVELVLELELQAATSKPAAVSAAVAARRLLTLMILLGEL
jgi:hypothetical protein